MANTNQPNQMPKPGQGQQGNQPQQDQPGRQGQPMPKAGQGQPDMGGRKNNEEVGEPIQLPDDKQQPQRKDQQRPQQGGNR